MFVPLWGRVLVVGVVAGWFGGGGGVSCGGFLVSDVLGVCWWRGGWELRGRGFWVNEKVILFSEGIR